MSSEDNNPPDSHSYLAGDHWLLQVSVRHGDPKQRETWHHRHIEIVASNDTAQSWNSQFWSMFPVDEPSLLIAVRDKEIVVSTGFPFRPTVSLRDHYGKYSASKMSGVAAYWRAHGRTPPPDLREIIAAYERDEALYGEQRQKAWHELVMRRLPHPPEPFYWHHSFGGLTMAGDVCSFRLWHPQLGYELHSE